MESIGRKIKMSIGLILVFVFFHKPYLTFAQKIWTEENGIVVIEAENSQNGIPDDNGWSFKNSPEGFSGPGYVKWTGSALTGKDNEHKDYQDIKDYRKLTYHFKINKTGIYYWRVRNYHNKRDGDNDCFVSVNKGIFRKTVDKDTLQWSWDDTPKTAYKILNDPGIYEFALGGRSKNFCVDRIVIFHEEHAAKNWPEWGPFEWMNTAIWSNIPESETFINNNTKTEYQKSQCNINVYPQPVRAFDFITIVYPKELQTKIKKLTLFNSFGQLVYNKNNVNKNEQIQIKKSGVFHLIITFDNRQKFNTWIVSVP